MAISGKEVAIILADFFDATEFNGLHKCLADAGALTSVVGEKPDTKLKDWEGKTEVAVEVSFEEARSYDFVAAIIPGKFSPDIVRANEIALDFVKSLLELNKVVGAIDHGAQVLISIGAIKEKNVAGWPSIRVDLENAGAVYSDEPVAIDGNIVTGRGPEDIKAFCDAIIEEIDHSTEAAA